MPTGCKCQGHSKSTFLLEQSRRLYHTDIVSYGSDLSNNPAGKNSMDQHQKTTFAALASDWSPARAAQVVFWCWSVLFFTAGC